MKTTIELCKAAGFPLMSFEGVTYVSPELERLVALVRADEREKAKHNEEVLMNALWKACGDDAQMVQATIDSQGETT
jgi:hypothetical protein